MRNEYFFIYMIYGIVYLVMGILPLQRRTSHILHLPLVKAIPYLAGFGLLHGISELLTTLVIADLYPLHYSEIFIAKQLLKALSFTMLIQFGLTLAPKKGPLLKIRPFLPTLLFLFWLSGFFFFLRTQGIAYHIVNPTYNIYTLRYFLGFSSGIMAGIALYNQGRTFRKATRNDIARRYEHLAYAFFAYGFVDGLIVREMPFFPANVLNNRLFLELFRFPIQWVKIMLGLLVTLYLMNLLVTFDWEHQDRIRNLEAMEISSKERHKLGMELHDALVQELFATRLNVQLLMKNASTPPETRDTLTTINQTLGHSLRSLRRFIHQSTLEDVPFQHLEWRLEQLANVSSLESGIQFSFSSAFAASHPKTLSSENSSQLYHIAQEAVHNVLYHSKATSARILLVYQAETLELSIQDDGIGISQAFAPSSNQFGLKSMQSRASTIGAQFQLENTHPGTRVSVMLPAMRGETHANHTHLSRG